MRNLYSEGNYRISKERSEAETRRFYENLRRLVQHILYQPFIGNGYVDGMKELTPEQNDALRNCFQ